MINAEDKKALVHQATLAQKNAYAPYSKYHVGAALLTTSGETFLGANVENAVYPLTICAERAAISSAVSAGARDIAAIAVVTRDGGTPCGACRQVMTEFGTDIVVLIADESGTIFHETTSGRLLPDSFNAENLKISG